MNKKKTVRQSQATLSQVMMPIHASHYGNVHGGVIMRLVDEVAFVAATRHAHGNVVTASIDSMSFEYPVHIGDVLNLEASLVHVGRTSMQVEVVVETEKLKTGKTLPVATAYLTLVALDSKGHPIPVPALIPETDEQKRKYQHAERKYAQRRRKNTI